MKLVMLITFILVIQAILFGQVEMPEIHTNIVIQSESYFGNEVAIQDSSYNGNFENIIYTVPENKFAVRSVTFGFEGKYKEKIEYSMEMGMATCAGGSGINILLMEASLFYKPNEFMKIGFMKGHIMRGFEMNEECTDVLTAEKPYFLNVFKNQCHPTGLIFEGKYDFTGTIGIKTQVAILNGPQEMSFDKEYDRNAALILKTPLPGLSLSGYYNIIKQDFGNIDSVTNEHIYEQGNRFGFGAEYDFNNIFFRGEYYSGRGFNGSLVPDSLKSSHNLKMNAFYIEGAYTIKTNIEEIPYIQSYLMFQSWNKASNVEKFYWDNPSTFIEDNILCKNFISSYLTLGTNLGLYGKHTKFKIDYEFPLDIPDNEPEQAKKLIIRLQTEF